MRKKGGSEHDNLERWLLTYADLITLLLGLFVILYASSQVDMKKYQKYVSAFASVFGGSGGNQGTMPGENGVLSATLAQSPLSGPRELERKVKSAVSNVLKTGGAMITEDERGVTVHLLEKLMFDPGKAELKPEAYPALDTLGFLLQSIPNQIRIEGHTDNTPIHTAQYPSNWQLSVARAMTVGYYLLTHYQIRPEKVAIIGYGEYHPFVPNDTPAHKAENRRVDIVILNRTTQN